MLMVLFFALTSLTALAQAPTVTSFAPSTVTQRTIVVINGTNFTGVTAANVKFGGVAATSITVNSATQITAVVGLGASGDVTVTNNSGTGSKTGIVFVAPAGTPSSAGISRIITDYNGYWSSTAGSTNPVKPDTRHNLMAFRYNNVLYSTGNESQVTNVLNSNAGTGTYTPGNFRALPINNINGTVSSSAGDPNLIVLASNIDGNAANQVPAAPGVAGLTVRDVLIDGHRGLDIGTGVTNLPTSSVLTFVATNILQGVVGDAIPDIVVSQIADPSNSSDVSNDTDIYCFIDATGNIVGNPVRVVFGSIADLGRYKSDFFTLTSGQSFNTSTINGSTIIGGNDRPIRAVGYKLSDFGITEANKGQAAFFKVLPAGKSDPAFIAYNRNSFDIPAPVITTEPMSVIVCPGGNATFTVVASGSELSYQWKKNGIDIPGATGSSYTVTNVQPADAAAYSVVVSNPSGSVFSANAYINNTVVVQPVDTQACLNTPASISVSANGANLQYQWYVNTTQSNNGGTLISGATSNTYSPPVNVAGTKYYYATIRNGNQACTLQKTNAIAFTVNGASVAGTATGSTTICAGSIAQLFITGQTGTVQWQSSTDGGVTYTDVTGGFVDTNGTYTTGAVAQTTYYRAVVSSGPCASATTSNPVIITVNMTNVWTGQVSTDWNTNGNWSCGSAPTLLINTEIPAVNAATNQPITNFPIIDGNTGIAKTRNITIASNASVTINGNGVGRLQIAGTITNNGVFTATDGTVAMVGTVAQTIPENAFNFSTIRNLTVANTTGVTIGGPLNLTGILTLTSGALNTNNVLTLKSNIATTAMIAPVTGSVNGQMIIERFIPARRGFRLISSPVDGGSILANWQEGKPAVDPIGLGTDITGMGGAANGFDTSGSNNPSLFEFNNATNVWSAVESTINTNLIAGKPLRILIRGDRTINQASNAAAPTNTTLRSTGTIKIGDVVVTDLSQEKGKRSFVGNPYQAPVNMVSTLNASTNLNKQFYYVYDPKLGGQPVVGQPGGRGAFVTVLVAPNGTTTNSAGSAANQYLQPNSACFVQTINDGPAALTFKETYKDLLTNATAQLYRTGENNEDNTAKIAMQLYYANSLSLNETANDGLIIEFGAQHSNDIDDSDAAKMTNQDENFAVLNGTQKLSVERRAMPLATEVLPLFNSTYTQANYTYAIQTEGITGVTPYLLDKYTNTTTELNNGGETLYSFTVNTDDTGSIAENRFDIVFEEIALGNNDNTLANGVSIYPNPSTGGEFFVTVPAGADTTSVTVFNVVGQKVVATTRVQADNTIAVSGQSMAAGVYMVKIAQQGKVVTKKLIIK